MIYIKNYRKINSQVFHNTQNNILQILSNLIGKTIIVFVDSGGLAGKGFTGILTEVLVDRIKLITELPDIPKNNRITKKRCSNLGTSTMIMVNHITAVTYNE